MSTSEQNVYTFQDVYFSINDKHPVSSARLVLAENAIPTMYLTLDPIHVMSDPTNKATAPQLIAFMSWHNQYVALAVKRTKCSFNADVLKGGKLEQNINLKDWILTGAGLSAVSAAGQFSLEIQMQHPMCLCQQSMLSIPYVQALSPISLGVMASYPDIVAALAGVTNILSLRLTATDLKSIAPAGCFTGEGPIDAQTAKNFLSSQMLSSAQTFSANLEWDAAFAGKNGYKAWPFSGCLSAYLGQIKYSLAECLTVSSQSNLWELLVGGIANEWLLSVMPTLTGKLKLRPFSPWVDPTLKIYDEDIPMLTLPGLDPNPILGVSVADVTQANGKSFFQYSPRTFSEAGMLYVPSGIRNNPDQYRGNFVQAHIPGWLLSAQNRQAGSDCSENNTWFRDQAGLQVSPINVGQGQLASMINSNSSSSTPSSLWSGAVFGLAKALFYSNFRQYVQAGVRTRLMFKTREGTQLLPCNVCSVISKPNQVAFDFYVTSVVHSFECEEGSAMTEIAGTYSRPRGGFPGIMPSGTPNPLYTV